MQLKSAEWHGGVVGNTAHILRVPGLILSLGLYGVSHVSACVSSGFSSFLMPPKNMLVV